jgi:hypothetical protein
MNRVFISHWKMQDCGIPFKVGDIIKWELSDCAGEFIVTEDDKKIYYDYDYDSHNLGDQTHEFCGVVLMIQNIYGKFEKNSETGILQYNNTTSKHKVINHKGTADGFENDLEDDYAFIGYIVELEKAGVIKTED